MDKAELALLISFLSPVIALVAALIAWEQRKAAGRSADAAERSAAAAESSSEAAQRTADAQEAAVAIEQARVDAESKADLRATEWNGLKGLKLVNLAKGRASGVVAMCVNPTGAATRATHASVAGSTDETFIPTERFAGAPGLPGAPQPEPHSQMLYVRLTWKDGDGDGSADWHLVPKVQR